MYMDYIYDVFFLNMNFIDLSSVRPKKPKIIVDTDTDSDNAESVPEKIEKPKAMVRGRSRRKDVEVEPEDKVSLSELCFLINFDIGK